MMTPKQKLRTLIELADAWDVEAIDAKVGRKETLQECADAVRMLATITESPDMSLSGWRAPTHRCSVCGAFWIEYSDGWSLCSQSCGPCCDNVPMGDQIEKLRHSDLIQWKERRP